MSFLLSNYKELGFDGLISVNGGCYYTNKQPYYEGIIVDPREPPIGITFSGSCSRTNGSQINTIQFIPTMISDGYGPDKRGYWTTLRPDGQMIMG